MNEERKERNGHANDTNSNKSADEMIRKEPSVISDVIRCSPISWSWEERDQSLDPKAKEIRDRLLRASRWRLSRDQVPRTASEDRIKIELAKQLIQDLEDGGPVGLIHIAAWSSATGTPIKIRTKPSLFNDSSETIHSNVVNVEYHQPSDEENPIGHWTLPGNEDPVNMEEIPNGCLFSVLASSMKNSAREVKTDLIAFLKQNIVKIAENMDDILWLHENCRLLKMEGGARYAGHSSEDAKRVIDNSQNRPCHGFGASGHPRGHASDPTATGPEDSVENYSRTGWKTGFLSRSDQDAVGHRALSHSDAQNAMNRLNRGSTSEAVHIPAYEVGGILPRGREFQGGSPINNERDITAVTLVLRHHAGQQNNPDADVFVHTFYPRL